MQQEYLNMRKTIAIAVNETKMVFSEPYYGGYVIADDEVELTNYLVHLPSQSDVIMDIDVEEEVNESAQITREHLKCYWLNILVKNYH